ncbi:MAG: DUF167 domain-containing protein [bacterium]|nr:DUF167 domain-containing protein [bacterium]
MPLKRNFQINITDARSGAAITVRASAGAAITEIGGQQEGVIKIRVKTANVESEAANAEIIAFLAAQLDIPVKHIEIVAGVNKADKLISIEGLTTAQVEEALLSDVGR